jgi:histidine ammonia-lyase
MSSKNEKEIFISAENVALSDYADILLNFKTIVIDLAQIDKVEKSYSFLKDFARKKVIYGINTGLGPMAQYKISEEDQLNLQYNLIRSHCSGTGNIMSPLLVKSAMICRMVNILQAYSGVLK